MVTDYIQSCRDKLHTLTLQPSCRPCDKVVHSVCKQLSRRHDIVVKPADKNLGTVVLTHECYTQLCMDHLSDINTYQEINDPQFRTIAYGNLRNILSAHECLYETAASKHVTPLAKSLLQREREPRILGRFYCLPKMHKSPLKGRPIVSCIGSLAYHTSKYLHNLLLPIMKDAEVCPSVCHSSDHVLKSVPRQFPMGTRVFCADITSLYPSIPIEYGLKAMDTILRATALPIELVKLMLALLEWVLRNNYFYFQGKTFLQLQGTAMGTPVAVCYANLVLTLHDRTITSTIKPVFYTRFIDDLFVIVNSEADSATLHALFNSLCAAIQLDSYTSAADGIFLDLFFELSGNGGLYHRMYEKPINKHLYIPPTSAHSKATLVNFIKNEVHRYTKLCSNPADAAHLVEQFRTRLTKRGYSHGFISRAMRASPKTPSPSPPGMPSLTSKRSSIKGPVLVLQQPCLLEPMVKFKDLFSIPPSIRELETYKRVFGSNDIVIGTKYGRCVGNYLLHNDKSKSWQADGIVDASRQDAGARFPDS